MPTNYPAGLDTFTNPTSGDPLDSPDHAGQHTDVNDAVEAIEAELGTDPAGVSATVKARLDALDTTVAAKATEANAVMDGDAAGGGLSGTYPNPTVDDGADGTAIHDNVAAEISAITEKASPVSADLLLIEDSAASNAKKRVQIGNLPRSSDTPWTEDHDAAGFDLTDVGQLAVGTTNPSTSRGQFAGAAGTIYQNGVLRISGGGNSSSDGEYNGMLADYVVSPSISGPEFYGLHFKPFSSGNGKFDALAAIRAAPTVSTDATVVYGTYFEHVQFGSGKVADLGVGYEARFTESFSGTISEMVGFRMTTTTVSAARTVWGFQIGDYDSYHEGKVSFGGTAAPTYAIDLKGTTQDRGVIGFAEQSATPTSPTSGAQALIYMKADKFVIAYNDGGTVRYKYLPLTGTSVTWVHTTTAP